MIESPTPSFKGRRLVIIWLIVFAGFALDLPSLEIEPIAVHTDPDSMITSFT